ncbi:MAG: MBOAT family protein [Lachnospiraceae bacterium]|nr:MBOAT family protein [Lachnospiraceae bacterium]
MNFISLSFLVFFPLVFVLYRFLPGKLRPYFLLVASWFFYLNGNLGTGWILLLTTGVTYLAALGMDLAQGNRTFHKVAKRICLLLGVITPLALLFYFKYLGFFSSNVNAFASLFGISQMLPVYEPILPVGISFYTFQTLSYVIDVYRGKIRAEKNPFYYALFVAFFPQLVAGPIERPENLLPQLIGKKSIGTGRDEEPATEDKNGRECFGDQDLIWNSFFRLLRGFFKKVAVADYLAVFVDNVYRDPAGASAPAVMAATVFFALQIYCDFSGYTDIACGAAGMLGIRLGENFRLPYLARNIRDFWRRWHISLTSWFTDYVYIPLGGNRKGLKKQIRNILLVFFLSGFWHGARWTFVAWGAVHGLMLAWETWRAGTAAGSIADKENSRFLPKRLSQGFGVIRTFVLVCLAWVLFRAQSLMEAGAVYKQMLLGWRGDLLAGTFSQLGLPSGGLLHVFLLLLCLALWDQEPDRTVLASSAAVRMVLQVMLIAFAWLLVLAGGGGNAFIYFQF